LERRARAQILVQHPRESLEAGIDAGEWRKLVEHAVAKARDRLFERGFQFHDVGEVAMLVQRSAMQQDLRLVVMAMLEVFRAPVAADQEVPGDEVAGDGES